MSTNVIRERPMIGLVFVCGVLAIVGGHAIQYAWLEALVVEFGVALIIAAVLAVLVDWTLKAGLARDVFETTFGYVLPRELRGELQWIYDQKLLCEQHNSHFTISKLDDRAVVLRETFDRVYRNVSNGSYEFEPSLAIDEWNHPKRKSRIVLLGYEVNGESVEEYEGQLAVEKLQFGVIRALPKHPRITLSPDQRIRVWGIIEEVPALNDHHVSVFKSATCNPHVRVTAEAGIEARVTFGHREKVHAKTAGPGVWQLEGVLLPNQHIRLEWRTSAT